MDLGIKSIIKRFRGLGQIGVGLSWFVKWYPWASTAPSSGMGESNTDAPLEQWDHHFPNVFLEQRDANFLCGHLLLRPAWWASIELSAGRLLNTRLSGTAMVEDEWGHLEKDPERYYNFKAKSGYNLGINLEIKLKKLIPNIDSLFTIRFSYQYTNVDFLFTAEKGSTFSIDFGYAY